MLLTKPDLNINNFWQLGAPFLHFWGAEIICRILLIKLIINALNNDNWGAIIAALLSGLVFTFAIYDISEIHLEVILLEYLIANIFFSTRSFFALIFADILFVVRLQYVPVFSAQMVFLFILIYGLGLIFPKFRSVADINQGRQ
ncbi:MAG: hypothetical protein NTV06_07770 [candidate division Zixibacteria bacterium]|nr:hypothetical protein [candidate division Zixibacteria bacterium]